MSFYANIKNRLLKKTYVHSKEALASELYNMQWAIKNDSNYIERILHATVSPFLLKHLENLPSAHILDVGSGPVSYMLHFVKENSHRFKLTAVDPLASEYAGIMEQYGYNIPQNINCYAEYLDEMFRPKTFDMIFCSNSLDHTVDVEKSLHNMSVLLKDDGFIYLLCNINEKDRTCGDGMHYHNLNLTEGRLTNTGQPVHMPHVRIYDFRIQVQTWNIGAEEFNVPRFEVILRKNK